MGLITAIRAQIDAKQARDTYFAAERQVAANLGALVFCSQPGERHASLAAAAVHASTAANMFTAGFGADPNEDEDGRDMAETLHHVATLYELLAAVEESLTFGSCVVPAVDNADLPEAERTLVAAAHGPLCEMAATPDLDARLRLLEKLYDAVEPVIGGQAGEALWCLPGQGFVGWTTEAERDEWQAARGQGRPSRTARRSAAVRAHLARVDRGYVAFHTAGTILGTLAAIWCADAVQQALTTSQYRLYTALVCAGAVIAVTCAAFAVLDVVRPDTDSTIRRLREMEDRITELDGERDATLDALRESDAKVTQLTNERDDARAELDDVRADRDSLLTERDELLADTDDAGEWARDLDAQIRPAVIASLEAEPDSRYVSDPPGYGQDTGEGK